MIKSALTINDLSNPYLHGLFDRVVTLFRELSVGTGLGHDVLILEEFGTTLIQKSWTDECGFYVKFRLHPLYSHLPKLIDAASAAQKRFAGIFGGTDLKVRDDETDRKACITMYVKQTSHSIGD